MNIKKLLLVCLFSIGFLSGCGKMNETRIEGSTLYLASVSYNFPVGYTFDLAKRQMPIELSTVKVTDLLNGDIGSVSTGTYVEYADDEAKLQDAFNKIYKYIHEDIDIFIPLSLEAEDSSYYISMPEFPDKSGLFIFKKDDCTFYYLEQYPTDNENILGELSSEILSSLGMGSENTQNDEAGSGTDVEPVSNAGGMHDYLYDNPSSEPQYIQVGTDIAAGIYTVSIVNGNGELNVEDATTSSYKLHISGLYPQGGVINTIDYNPNNTVVELNNGDTMYFSECTIALNKATAAAK